MQENITFSMQGVSKSFTQKDKQCIQALDSLSFDVHKGSLVALVGPDGAGKSTCLRLIIGLLEATNGKLYFENNEYNSHILGEIQEKIAYMPQKFGLYEDLTVQENLDLYADLKNYPKEKRQKRYDELLKMCAMEPFTERLAGKLSGGMKQKLGLICTLISPPTLLLLDEPTVGVDPLSRRELWEIIEKQTKSSAMSAIISTSYLDEAAKCDEVIMLFEGKTLAKGKPNAITQESADMCYKAKINKNIIPRELQSKLFQIDGMIDAVPQGDFVRFVHGTLSKESQNQLNTLLKESEIQKIPPSLEDSFMLLLRREVGKNKKEKQKVEEEKLVVNALSLEHKEGDSIIITENVSRYFNDFIAVDNVSFSVKKGEVFGLLGPNGAGKTTTFRMLCGLLPASKGSVYVAGINVAGTNTATQERDAQNKKASAMKSARAKARHHLGYVAQKFSLYGTLSAKENLEFFAGTYGLNGKRKKERIEKMIEEFSLQNYLKIPSHSLPGGYKQRLAMAVGLLHEPSILFLDEATSGADPIARREFWQRISTLAKNKVTIVVTTHFMEEAEYCDRVLIQDRGKMLALGTPHEIRSFALQNSLQSINSPNNPEAITMEEAFIAIVENSREQNNTEKTNL